MHPPPHPDGKTYAFQQEGDVVWMRSPVHSMIHFGWSEGLHFFRLFGLEVLEVTPPVIGRIKIPLGVGPTHYRQTDALKRATLLFVTGWSGNKVLKINDDVHN